MSAEDDVEIGPIDYVLVEWKDRQPNGEAMPHLLDLVDRGVIRILDLAFITKAEDGSHAGVDLAELSSIDGLEALVGAASGLLADEDLEKAADALEPGTSAALLVYENSWAAPFATALRNNGAQLVAGGRIPVEDVLEALEAAEQAG